MTTETSSTRRIVRRKTPAEANLPVENATASKQQKAGPVLGGRKVKNRYLCITQFRN